MAIRVFMLAVGVWIAPLSFGEAATITFEGFSHGDTVSSVVASDGSTVIVDGANDLTPPRAWDSTQSQDDIRKADWDLLGPFEDATGAGPDLDAGVFLVMAKNPDGSLDDGGGAVTLIFDRAVDIFGFDLIDDTNVDISGGGETLSYIRYQPANHTRYERIEGPDGVPLLRGVQEVTFTLSRGGGIDNIDFADAAPVPVPVPTPVALLAGGVAALALLRVRRRGGGA